MATTTDDTDYDTLLLFDHYMAAIVGSPLFEQWHRQGKGAALKRAKELTVSVITERQEWLAQRPLTKEEREVQVRAKALTVEKAEEDSSAETETETPDTEEGSGDGETEVEVVVKK